MIKNIFKEFAVLREVRAADLMFECKVAGNYTKKLLRNFRQVLLVVNEQGQNNAWILHEKQW